MVHRVGLSAVFGPLLFGHASGLQGSTCRPAVTVGNEPGGADGVGLPCWSEQQQSLKGKQNKKVLWCHGLRGLVWKASGCALAIPTRSMNSDGQLMTPYSAACDLDHTPGALRGGQQLARAPIAHARARSSASFCAHFAQLEAACLRLVFEACIAGPLIFNNLASQLFCPQVKTLYVHRLSPRSSP